MRRRGATGAVALLAVVGGALAATAGGSTTSPTAAANWTLRDLGACGPDCRRNSFLINDRGQVAGAGRGGAFFWENGPRRKIGALGGDYSTPLALNERGQVVGSAATRDRLPGEWSFLQAAHAFLWWNGKMTDLGTFGGLESEAVAINERGQIVGWSETPSGAKHAFLWENGTMHDLGTLGGEESEAVAINDRGQVVGWSDTAKHGSGRVDVHSFLWEDGHMRDLEPQRDSGISFVRAINERGQVIGDGDYPGGPFFWANDRMRAVGAAFDSVVAINDRGQVVVERDDGTDRFHVWWDGRTRFVRKGEPRAIADSGQITGSSEKDYGRPTVWRSGRAAALTLPLLRPRHSYGEGTDINARGQIVGWSGNVDHVVRRGLASPQIEIMPGRIVLWTPKPVRR